MITAIAEKQIYEYLAFIAEQWPEKIVKEAAWALKRDSIKSDMIQNCL